MSDTELKKQYPPVQGAAEERQPQGEVKDISKLLSSFGGFNAVRGFLPEKGSQSRFPIGQTIQRKTGKSCK